MPAAVVVQRDEHDLILGSLRVRETRFGVDLDVELEAVQVVERHALEAGAARLHQVLLSRGVDLIDGRALGTGGRLLDVPERFAVGGPAFEDDQIAEVLVPCHRAKAKTPPRIAPEQPDVGQQEERIERLLFDA